MASSEIMDTTEPANFSMDGHEDDMDDEIVVNTSGIVADDESGGRNEEAMDDSFMTNDGNIFLSPALSKQSSSGQRGGSSLDGDPATPDVVASGDSVLSSARSVEELSPVSRKTSAAKKPASKKRNLKSADINDDGSPRKRPTKKTKAPLPAGRKRRVSILCLRWCLIFQADRSVATEERHRKPPCITQVATISLLTHPRSPRWTSAAATTSATTTTRCSST